MPVTITDALNQAHTRLADAAISDARLDAEVLLRCALNKDRAWLLAHLRDGIPDAVWSSYQALIERREKHEPLQYITGTREFWGRDFLVTPAVLIPRPETELIVDSVLHAVPDRRRPVTIIDLCTGSGCIAISLAMELPEASVVVTDISPAALDVARKNAEHHGVADRIRFIEGDLFGPLERLGAGGSADVITANPPYVPASLLGILPPEVRDFEPAMALVAGPDGIEFHKRIISGAPLFLKPGGKLIMEMGIGQAQNVKHFAQNDDRYHNIEIRKDLAGIDRTIILSKTF